MRYTDHLNRTIEIHERPQRIISLVPSQTELLADIGLEKEVVGITKFCVHPEKWFRSKTRVGGTKKLNIPLIHSLNPDLIIANKEENEQEQINELMKDYPVWISDIQNLSDAKKMMIQIGQITGKYFEVVKLIARIDERFQKLFEFLKKLPKKKIAYFIWHNPMMVAGDKTFICNMINACGFENVFCNDARYPQISSQALQKKNPEYLLLSSEPFPFSDKHLNDYQKLAPKAKAILVDGEMFSWYGSHLLKAPEYFMNLRQQLAN